MLSQEEQKEKQNWLHIADTFAQQGDAGGMRACAREIAALAENDIDSQAIWAAAEFYSGNIDEAAERAQRVLQHDARHFRARLVKYGVLAAKFELDKVIPGLHRLLQENDLPLPLRSQALGYLIDAEILAAEPERAARNLLELSRMQDGPLQKSLYYSKALFLTNYSSQAVKCARELHAKFNDFFRQLPAFPARTAGHGHRLRIGYISPDFRLHAAAYFFTPLFRDFTKADFDVYCYAAGRSDAVTAKFRRFPVRWRNIAAMTAAQAAKLVHEDGIDILVDLAGHTEGNCLPVLAYRPAPVQLSGIGYMNTTGLQAVDYFLSDRTCLPLLEETRGFTEHIVHMPHCHLCYAPELLRQMPEPAAQIPRERYGHVTFGSFNNFAKVTEATMMLWREVLRRMPEARLVIKAKICSITSGREIVQRRLQAMGISLSQIELRPYSRDYLEQYRDIDIALDTTPYTGGLTTCEALYMGVPVISLRGRTHGARFGASILENAGVPELIANSDLEYVAKAVQLAKSPAALVKLHKDLRATMRRSPLMDAREYMRDLEAIYRKITVKRKS